MKKWLLSLLMVMVLSGALVKTVAADTFYVVQSGDTLFGIAIRFGVTQQALMTANGIVNADLIYVGQTLRIPDGLPTTGGGSASAASSAVTVNRPKCSSVYTVQAGDKLGVIAASCGTTWQELVRLNRLESSERIYVGQKLLLPNTKKTTTAPSPIGGAFVVETYIVHPGDTLMAIASRKGLTLEILMAANGMTNAETQIFVGQRLIVPPSNASGAQYSFRTVGALDTLDFIARENNVPIETLMAVNGLTNATQIFEGLVLIIPITAIGTPPTATPMPTLAAPGNSPCGSLYIIQRGDTLGSIATKCGVDIYALIRLNKITNVNLIYVGKLLEIP